MTHVTDDGPKSRSRRQTNASVDRIDSNRGYVEDNVQLVCKAVNLMKNELTMDELDYWCCCILSEAKLTC